MPQSLMAPLEPLKGHGFFVTPRLQMFWRVKNQGQLFKAQGFSYKISERTSEFYFMHTSYCKRLLVFWVLTRSPGKFKAGLPYIEVPSDQSWP